MTLVSRTRVSTSIPGRLLRQGKLHLLPVYALMRTSDLAREGIENSGSYRFADHVYRAVPSGRYGIGRAMDALLLRMGAARSMRNRYLYTRRCIVSHLLRADPGRSPAVLSVPCGIARELLEAACEVRERAPEIYTRTTFHGIDLDPEPLELTRTLAREAGVNRLSLTKADAFDPGAYPPGLDVIVSTGFGDFIKDRQLRRFYGICRDALRPGGRFATSGMQRHRLADYLLREIAEITVYYRAPDRLAGLARESGFRSVDVQADPVGLQSLVLAST